MPQTLQARRSLVERYTAEFTNSRKLFEQAKELFPQGVTHDLRHLEPFPVYVDRAQGAYKWDVDGHRLIDYWSGHGALLLGHSHPDVVEAVQRQMGRATHPGACHELEIEWGQWVRRLVPSAEKLRFVSSGTEATLMALRLARIFTGRPRVLKFAGHFHGWHDFLVPGADLPYDGGPVPGLLAEVQAETVIVPPNDPAAVECALTNDQHIGCVILEPTGGHFGAVPIRGEFLRALREITARHQRLLIFDEVISGFRVHPGGAQGLYGVTPDLTTLAKILAGGLPGGAVTGRKDILDLLDFQVTKAAGKEKIAHPGTFNANPLSAAAGIATLRIVRETDACERANRFGKNLRRRLNEVFEEERVPWAAYGTFSSFELFTNPERAAITPTRFDPLEHSVASLKGERNAGIVHKLRLGMMIHGVDLSSHPGGVISATHGDA
ncbi:MAG TPA: aspartate aminotransferase family protein, partial [Gemmataceae bacterium]|nr:aspartate aminotransferase family protein [Gemmataceae bacterium]